MARFVVNTNTIEAMAISLIIFQSSYVLNYQSDVSLENFIKHNNNLDTYI